ncbi:hypothetical protein I4U23_009416 [Adineta vaga]|nr:hypothetical protein I4U23_009416 [Adineta vaga]
MIQQCCHLPSSTIQNRFTSIHDENNNRKTSKRLRSTRKKTNDKQCVTNHFHYQNMITVRQISCQDMIARQRLPPGKCRHKLTNLRNNKQNNKMYSPAIVKNKSQVDENFPTYLSSEAPFTQMQTSSQQSMNIILSSSPLAINNKNKMSNKMSITNLKVTLLRDSSTRSLESTDLHAMSENNRLKPAITNVTLKIDSQTDSRSFVDTSPNHLSTTNSSIVPHFSSTNAPDVPLNTSSPAIGMSKAFEKESKILTSNENIQDLIDQLQTCIVTLNLLIQTSAKHEKNIISNEKIDEQRSRVKKKNNSTRCLQFRKRSSSNKDHLLSVDLTVKQCTSFKSQQRPQQNDQKHCLSSRNTQHEELKRCLLIYCRD